MKNLFIYFVIILVFKTLGCAQQSRRQDLGAKFEKPKLKPPVPKLQGGDINGTYLRKDLRNEKLIFSGPRFSYEMPINRHNPEFNCCDTITFGTWKQHGKDFIALTSAQFLFEKDLGVDVTESQVGQQDSIRLLVTNLIESQLKFTGNKRDVIYSLKIFTPSGSKIINAEPRGSGNSFKFLMGKNEVIEKFYITASPGQAFWGRNKGVESVNTKLYEVRRFSSNYFIVNIPLLTYDFLTYLRLNGDFIKINNNRSLVWDGKIYEKN
ncbi:MAG TPA: hypothetical protein VKB19_17775 [Pedobacter sp.]|nr:hypothetical protein [Pedobacter sp.]